MPSRRSGSAAIALQDSAPVFAALGDEVRLRLVSRLCEDGPASITQLTEGSHVTRQAITKHLRVMEDAGLVSSQKTGRTSVWTLTPDRIDAAKSALDEISDRWELALGRLRRMVED